MEFKRCFIQQINILDTKIKLDKNIKIFYGSFLFKDILFTVFIFSAIIKIFLIQDKQTLKNDFL